jgi:hypothetical protein
MAVKNKALTDEAIMNENWLADRIYASQKGNLTPTRAYIIEELNRKRRKEGIYARPKRDPVRKKGL